MGATGDIGGIYSHLFPPSISSSLQVLGRREGPGPGAAWWGRILGQGSSPSSQSLSYSPLPPGMAEPCLSLVIPPWAELLLKITPWKARGPLSLHDLGTGHPHTATDITCPRSGGRQKSLGRQRDSSGRLSRLRPQVPRNYPWDVCWWQERGGSLCLRFLRLWEEARFSGLWARQHWNMKNPSEGWALWEEQR